MAITSRGAGETTLEKRRGLYNGWYIAIFASLASGLTIGTSNYAFGVFIEPLEVEVVIAFDKPKTFIPTCMTSCQVVSRPISLKL